jgi:hypothetical protein
MDLYDSRAGSGSEILNVPKSENNIEMTWKVGMLNVTFRTREWILRYYFKILKSIRSSRGSSDLVSLSRPVL